ncbi:MAG: PH domain-containing protein [Aigarchaeota archaeon]|nr:PH domain-containing protein [Aigarchaeota archaeon]
MNEDKIDRALDSGERLPHSSICLSRQANLIIATSKSDIDLGFHMRVVGMNDVLYEERVPAGALMKVLAGSFSLLMLCILLVTVAVGVVIEYPFLTLAFACFLGFFLFLFWNYRGLRIKVNGKNLLVDYGLFNRKRIPIVDIVSCEPTKASFGRYGGVGIRYGTDRSWAYTTSLGDAVKIVPWKGRPFVFSSNDPERICSIINEMKNVS